MGAYSPQMAANNPDLAVYPDLVLNPPISCLRVSSGSSPNPVKEQKSKRSQAVEGSVSAAASPGCPLNPSRRAKAGAVESWA
jgi:hypothetical protein